MEKLTEEAGVCSPLPDVRHSDAGRCLGGEPPTPAEAPRVNGQQEAAPWEEMEVSEAGEDRTRPDPYRPVDAQTTPAGVEEEDQWESAALPVYPMSQPAAPLSFATVQWDAPRPSSDTPSPMTDSSSADELDWTVNPLSLLHRFAETDAEVPARGGDAETWDGSQVRGDETAADLCRNLRPRDDMDTDAKDQTTQEETPVGALEDHDGTLRRLDPADESGESVTEDAAEPVVTFPGPREGVDSEPGVERESPRDSRLEEEQEKPAILLTGQTDSAQEPCPAATDGVKTEEENEEGGDEDGERTSEAFNGECEEGETADSTCPCEKERAEEPTPIDHAGIPAMPDQPIHLDRSADRRMDGRRSENETGSENDNEDLPEHSREQQQSIDVLPVLTELREEDSESTDEDEPAGCEEVNQEEARTELSEDDEDVPRRRAYNGRGSEDSCSKEPEQTGRVVDQSQQTRHSQRATTASMKEVELAERTRRRESRGSGECGQPQPTDQPAQMEQSDQRVLSNETRHSEDSEQSDQRVLSNETQHSEDSEQSDQRVSSNETQHSEDSEQSDHRVSSNEAQHSEDSEQSDQRVLSNEAQHSEDSEQSKQSQHPEQTQQTDQRDESDQPEGAHSEQVRRPEASERSERPEATEEPRRTEQSEQLSSDREPPALSEQGPEEPPQTDPSKQIQQRSPEIEPPALPAETELTRGDRQTDTSDQTEHPGCGEDASSSRTAAAAAENGGQSEPSGTAETLMNGGGVDREKASRLAERLHKLDGIQRTDVVKHVDKDNDFSRAVGEEYLKFFDFTGQTLDQALRSFLKVVVLIGETQERERVLQHFSTRFHQCNPESFSPAGSVLTLTCALMLLNTDLHGQNVGKAMSMSSFVSNLDGMNEGENFDKDLLKSFYGSIKSEPLEWAVDEDELKTSMLLEEDAKEDAPLRSKSNPFQDVPHDKKATVFKQGFVQRKAHADIDGKRIPWGRRSWKTFYGVLKGMVLYLQKDEYRKEYHNTEEVVSVHHALAERAADYTKRPHVFRLQTADWRVFLFQASSRVEMHSWIGRINLVSALHSSPPFPAAVGSQRRFCRPILPASQSAQTLERQLQSHAGMLESFQADLAYLQESLPEGRRAKAKELEEHRVREEYLQHETCRYEIYIQVLEAWKGLDKTADTAVGTADFNLFDKALCKDALGEEEEEEEEGGGLKKSHSSPALDVEMAPPPIVKVRRNISERRTYRRIVIPRRNKDI